MPPHPMTPAPPNNVAEEYFRYERNPDVSIAENVVRFYWLWFHTRLGRSYEYEAAQRLIDLLPFDWEDWTKELLDDLTEPDAEIGRHVDFQVFVRHVLLQWIDHGNLLAPLEPLLPLDPFHLPTFPVHDPPPPQPVSAPSHLYTIRSSYTHSPHVPSFTVEPYSPPVIGYPLHHPDPYPSHPHLHPSLTPSLFRGIRLTMSSLLLPFLYLTMSGLFPLTITTISPSPCLLIPLRLLFHLPPPSHHRTRPKPPSTSSKSHLTTLEATLSIWMLCPPTILSTRSLSSFL